MISVYWTFWDVGSLFLDKNFTIPNKFIFFHHIELQLLNFHFCFNINFFEKNQFVCDFGVFLRNLL